ncbi:Mu-like prophage FluMu protein gp41 [Pseudomonas sp. GM41(2012)]|uniref:phage tail assembly protein n=1 Tax=Pseudomonas sp. (strain GM41(2012)) TaxID=1144708 RepID=UPI0002705426|nr:phage tail assembly protein [Pseudomonas sp. GM41(2012)]EUB74472.1 Mu-like prophage FluMu protein gp41 [Pseudomonas sp. GM41(2012)]
MTQVSQDSTVPALPKWLKLADEGVTVTLKYSTVISGVMTDALTIRAPSMKDWRASKIASNGDYEKQELSLFSSLTGLSEEELLTLKYKDYQRLSAGYFRLVDEDDV